MNTYEVRWVQAKSRALRGTVSAGSLVYFFTAWSILSGVPLARVMPLAILFGGGVLGTNGGVLVDAERTITCYV